MTLLPTLDQLENAQLLRRLSEEELSYIFKTALVQDSAYQSLLKQDRRQLHRAVGKVLEEAYPAQLDENSALLARHFAQAGERDKAIAYARRAARRSLSRYAFEEAVHQLEDALSWVESDAPCESRFVLIEEAGDANRLLRQGERALALYQQAITLWNQQGDDAHWNVMRLHCKVIQTVIDVKWSVAVDVMRRVNQIGNDSLVSLESATKLTQDLPPRAEMAEALTMLSMAAWRLQSAPDWVAAEEYARDAVAMAEEIADPGILSRALDALASVCDGRGRLREHLLVTLRRLTVTQDPEFENLRERIDAMRGVGLAQMYLGEYAQALPRLREAETLAENIQAVELQSIALSLQAQCLFRLDRWDETLELEKKWRALERNYPRERVGVTCFSVALSANIYTLRGEQTQAQSYGAESFKQMFTALGPIESWQRNPRY